MAKRKPAKRSTIKPKAKRAATSRSGKSKRVAPKSAVRKSGKSKLDFSKQSIDQELNARWDELIDQKRNAEMVLEKMGSQLIKLADVTSVSVDFKMKNGETARPLRYVLRLTVDVKRHEDDQYIETLVPKVIDGVETDVVGSTFKRCSGGSEESTFRKNPIGGCAIGRAGHEKDWGTLGVAVKYGNSVKYLTNFHVSGDVGTVIRQPPKPVTPIDPPSNWEIGVVSRVGRVTNDMVDCALITPSTSVNGRKPTKGILGLPDNAIEIGVASLGQVVFFVGAASGNSSRTGKVVNTNAFVKFENNTILSNQILVQSDDSIPLSVGGDSGSLLLTTSKNNDQINLVIGLVVGAYEIQSSSGTKQGLVANHFSQVKSDLKFQEVF